MDSEAEALPNIPAVIEAAKAVYVDLEALYVHVMALMAAIKNEKAMPAPSPTPAPSPAIVSAQAIELPSVELITEVVRLAAADDADKGALWNLPKIKGLIDAISMLTPLVPQIAPLVLAFQALFASKTSDTE